MSEPPWKRAAEMRAGWAEWPRFADGYQACPACGCLVHPTYAKVHAEACAEIRRMEGNHRMWKAKP